MIRGLYRSLLVNLSIKMVNEGNWQITQIDNCQQSFNNLVNIKNSKNIIGGTLFKTKTLEIDRRPLT